MARVPMTARQQLERARDLGHVLSVVKRGPWPEHGDPHPKWFISCTCGWVGASVRSESARNAGMIWHLGKAIAEVDSRRVNGV